MDVLRLSRGNMRDLVQIEPAATIENPDARQVPAVCSPYGDLG